MSSITRYFADENRSQAGNDEVEIRLGPLPRRAGIPDGPRRRGDRRRGARRASHLRIQQMIAVRMSVAIRLRHATSKDPVDTHTIAMRLRAWATSTCCRADEHAGVAGDAAFPAPGPGAQPRHASGWSASARFDAGARQDYLKRTCQAAGGVRRRAEAAPGEPARTPCSSSATARRAFEPSVEDAQERNLHMVRERDLCARFGLVPAEAHDRHPPDGSRLAALADIEDSVRGSADRGIGAHSVIDSFVKIKPAGRQRRPGDRRACRPSIPAACSTPATASRSATMSPSPPTPPSRLSTTPTGTAPGSIAEQGFLPVAGGIVIEDDVWIGANCVLLDGAVLRRGCVIGAGSLVRGEVAAYYRQRRQPAGPAVRRAANESAPP